MNTMPLTNKLLPSTVAAIILFPVCLFSQEYNTTIKFKDGKINSYASEFINSCVDGFSNYNISKSESKSICYCLIEELANEFTSTEFIKISGEIMMQGKSNQQFGQLMATNETFLNAALSCFKTDSEILNLMNDNMIIDDNRIELGAELHLNELKKQSISEYNEISKYVNMKAYSECFIRKLYQEFTLKEMYGDDPKITSRVEKIQEECMIINLKE